MNKIEIHQAFFWQCLRCAAENFERAVLCEMTDDDKREAFGLDPWEEVPGGDFYMAPTHVNCRECGLQYETVDSASAR